MLRVIGRLEFFDLIFRIVINDEFDRILNCDTTIGFSIWNAALASFPSEKNFGLKEATSRKNRPKAIAA